MHEQERKHEVKSHSESRERMGAIIDTETTGLSNNDELIEIGIVLFLYNDKTGKLLEIIDEHSSLRQPNCKISSGASAVHGLIDENLFGKRLDKNRITNMLNKAQILISHNVDFDKRFVSKLFPIVNQKKWYCTMNGIPWYRKGFPSKSLQSLLNEHNIAKSQSHRALDDAKSLFRLISKRDKKHGKTYFFELIKPYMVEENKMRLKQEIEWAIQQKKETRNIKRIFFLLLIIVILLAIFFKLNQGGSF